MYPVYKSSIALPNRIVYKVQCIEHSQVLEQVLQYGTEVKVLSQKTS